MTSNSSFLLALHAFTFKVKNVIIDSIPADLHCGWTIFFKCEGFFYVSLLLKYSTVAEIDDIFSFICSRYLTLDDGLIFSAFSEGSVLRA